MANNNYSSFSVNDIVYRILKEYVFESCDVTNLLVEAYRRESRREYYPKMDERFFEVTQPRCEEEKKALEILYHDYLKEEQKKMPFNKWKSSTKQKENSCVNNEDSYETGEKNMSEDFVPDEKNSDEVADVTDAAGETDVINEPQIPDFSGKNATHSETQTEMENLKNEIKRLREDFEKKETQYQSKIREAEEMKLQYQKKEEELAEKDIEIKREWHAKYEAEHDKLLLETKKRLAEQETELENEAKEKAEDTYKDLLKGKINDYVSGVRDEWRQVHEDMAETNEDIAKSMSTAKVEASNESSRIQREMRETIDRYKEELDGSMLQFFAGLDKWRESVFDAQFKGFAEWYSRFCGFVDRFDTRFVNSIGTEESDNISKIGSSLNSLKNALERTLPAMGLKSYYPLQGDVYDPVYHEAAEEEYVPEGTIIKRCVNPGVELVSSNDDLRRVIVKAEVDVEVN